jgi:small subunit ribosomal protein S9
VTEHPEDDRPEEELNDTAAPEAQPPADEPPAEAPAASEPATQQPAASEPAAEPVGEEAPPEEPPAAGPVAEEAPPEEPPAAGPVAEEAPPEEPAAAEGPGADEPATQEAPPAAEETPATQAPAAEAGAEAEEIEVAPRQKPEIPGADLIPDIVPEGEQFLDAEAQAAAEAEAEAAAAREQDDAVEEAQPIADAAIDLAAGARYTATGKRKTAVARVILKPGSGTYSINGKQLDTAFPRETLQRMIRQPLETVGYESRMDVVARMHGGGVAAQAGALRHGISKALIVADPHLRGELKRRGFLTRDPRVKERKKAGLKKARKRPQFSKR